MLPDFLCIGAPRSGTTWLYMNLQEHPEVWVPPIKELHYFDEKVMFDSLPLPQLLAYKLDRYKKYWRRIEQSIKLQNKSEPLDIATLSWYFRYFFGLRCDEWYASLFENGAGKTTGEITPAYGRLSVKSVAYIHELMPDIKIIFLMRNPMQRAWSHFLKNIRRTKRPLESFSKEEFISHFNSDYSRVRSSYSQTIETWRTYYPEEQFFTAFFEEIINSPEKLLVRIFEFIGIEASSQYISNQKISKKYNTASKAGIIPDNLTIPDDFTGCLAQIYSNEIEKLYTKFGGYASSWFEDVNKYLERVNYGSELTQT